MTDKEKKELKNEIDILYNQLQKTSNTIIKEEKYIKSLKLIEESFIKNIIRKENELKKEEKTTLWN